MTGSEIISANTRIALNNLISDAVSLSDIDQIWQNEGFVLPFQDFEVVGRPGLPVAARRFQGYMNQVDWSDHDEVAKAVSVFKYVLRLLEEQSPFDLSTEMHRLKLAFEDDGYHLTDDGHIEPIARGAVNLTGLTESPLKSDQMQLLRVLYRIVATPDWGLAMSWPNWNFIRNRLRGEGMAPHKADEAIMTLPYTNVFSRSPYSLVWRSQSNAGVVQPSETIGLTMAGLARVDAPAADGLARLAQAAAQKEADLPVEPHHLPAGVWALTDVIPSFLSRPGSQLMNTPTTADLLKHEPIPLAGDTQGLSLTYEVKLGDGHLAAFLNVATAQEYFRAVAVSVVAMRSTQRDAARETINVMSAPNNTQHTSPPPDRRSVFLVHGRNEAARDAMTEFLRALDLSVISWTKANTLARTALSRNPSTLETVQAGLRAAAAVVVLFTPDDLVALDPRMTPGETQLTGQARPNVILEAGMIIGMDDAKAIFVQLGKQRAITDIAGINFVNIGDGMEKKEDLANRLLGMNLEVDKDWRRMEAIKFDHTLDYLSAPPPFA